MDFVFHGALAYMPSEFPSPKVLQIMDKAWQKVRDCSDYKYSISLSVVQERPAKGRFVIVPPGEKSDYLVSVYLKRLNHKEIKRLFGEIFAEIYEIPEREAFLNEHFPV